MKRKFGRLLRENPNRRGHKTMGFHLVGVGLHARLGGGLSNRRLQRYESRVQREAQS